MISEAAAPIKPEDTAWMQKRLHADGEAHGLESLLMWIKGRARVSPDGAENTEDGT